MLYTLYNIISQITISILRLLFKINWSIFLFIILLPFRIIKIFFILIINIIFINILNLFLFLFFYSLINFLINLELMLLNFMLKDTPFMDHIYIFVFNEIVFDFLTEFNENKKYIKKLKYF